MEPYKVQVPQAALDDLKARIKNTRWPEKEPVSDWSQGTPLGWLQNICEYWGSSYDWRRIETKLNEYEGYTLSLDPPGESAPNPCDIHFLHIRSKHEDATPLVMTHRLARLGPRVPQSHRPPHRPHSSWRGGPRRVSSRITDTSRVRVLRKTHQDGLGHRAHCGCVGSAHAQAGL